jgi:serine/threonine protein kinase
VTYDDLLVDVVDFRDESHLGGAAYVVTRLGQGSLEAWMDRSRAAGAAASDDLAALMDTVLLCLAGLHSRGFVHLDLKASKFVFFNGRLKLTGFGDCRKVGAKATLDAYVPLYASPELREHADAVAARLRAESDTLPELPPKPRLLVDWTIDAWSVGMLLCQLSTLDDPEAYRAEDFCRDPREGESFGVFAALTLDGGGSSGWYDKFFEWACTSARSLQLVEVIIMALCARDPQFRFSCAEFMHSEGAGVEGAHSLARPVCIGELG